MIFRTGSVLIVGMCDEQVLRDIYHFIKSLLKEEFAYICQELILDQTKQNKKKKVRRRLIHIVGTDDEEHAKLTVN
jgi:hypothetical protein